MFKYGVCDRNIWYILFHFPSHAIPADKFIDPIKHPVHCVSMLPDKGLCGLLISAAVELESYLSH